METLIAWIVFVPTQKRTLVEDSLQSEIRPKGSEGPTNNGLKGASPSRTREVEVVTPAIKKYLLSIRHAPAFVLKVEIGAELLTAQPRHTRPQKESLRRVFSLHWQTERSQYEFGG